VPRIDDGDRGAHGANCVAPGFTLTEPLALDIETYNPVHFKLGRSACSAALSPFRSDIRLIAMADAAGNVATLDLGLSGKCEVPPELQTILRDSDLIIHHAAFELTFLGLKLGIIPQKVFCTLTAARLLTPTRNVKHDLGSVLARHLQVKITKDLGGSDWGAMMLTPDQLSYAQNEPTNVKKIVILFPR
jgi:hypothetical protein